MGAGVHTVVTAASINHGPCLAIGVSNRIGGLKLRYELLITNMHIVMKFPLCCFDCFC
jgi:hypothetical protein